MYAFLQLCAIYFVQIPSVLSHIWLRDNISFFLTNDVMTEIAKIYYLVDPSTLYIDPGIEKTNKIVFALIGILLAKLLKISFLFSHNPMVFVPLSALLKYLAHFVHLALCIFLHFSTTLQAFYSNFDRKNIRN